MWSLAAQEEERAALSTVPPPVSLDYDEPSQVFIQRFLEEVTGSDSLVFDRYTGPSPRLGRTRSENRLGYVSIERANSSGASLFAAIGMDSLRRASLAVLPLEFWQEHWQGWLADLIAGTVGNPEEERVRFNSVDYSATRSSWESATRNRAFTWGLRPWRTNPYIYFLIRAGHLQGQPLLTFEARAGYTLLGTTRLEGRLTLPLPASFRISAGTSVDPSRLGLPDSSMPRVAVTLERVLRVRDGAPLSVFYIGFRSAIYRSSSSARQESLLVAGLSRSW